MGDYSLPRAELARIRVTTVVIDGNTSPWITKSANEVAAAIPKGQRRTLSGQQHNVDPAAIAPVLAEFFKS
jgi:hypothetical protein